MKNMYHAIIEEFLETGEMQFEIGLNNKKFLPETVYIELRPSTLNPHAIRIFMETEYYGELPCFIFLGHVYLNDTDTAIDCDFIKERLQNICTASDNPDYACIAQLLYDTSAGVLPIHHLT